MRCFVLVLLLTVAAATVQHKPSAALTNINDSPIQKVVTLVREMKDQTIKEGEQDLEAYDKYTCWCETTTAEKTAAIDDAETKLKELGSFVEEAAAKEGELKTEIAGLEEDIASDTDALATATKTRDDQHNDFEAEEADMKETIGLLTEAVTILSKVQLLQKPETQKEALLQVRGIVRRVSPKFQNVMQKDLYDMLGEFKGVDQHQEQTFGKTLSTASFLGEVFLPKREAAMLAQNQGLLQAKADPKVGGAAAGAKSYNSRSGGIFGLLKQQEEEFTKNLAKATKEEKEADAAFQKLTAAKKGEIAAATQQKDAKSSELAELMDKASKAKEDIEATTKALDADQTFLAETTKSCKTETDLYQKRSKTRNDEIEALSETLDILTGDEARSLFDKTISFVQVESRSNTARTAIMMKAQNKAMQRILMMAKKNKNWQLASLAVRVKLDAFTKVKKAMDTMLAELKNQQKAEYAKWETCKKDIDETEDKIWNGKVEKRDLGEKHKDIMNTLATGDQDIEDLKAQVAEAEVSLKKAGEQRKADNGLFQTSIADQRATIAILQMASKRLKAFYEPKAELLQVRLHASANPPPRPSGPEAVGYKKSGSSGGVMQLLSMIIADAGRTVDELNADEQQSQADYSEFVSTSTASIEADREAIAEKEEQVASAKSEKSETEESQMANEASLGKLAELLQGIHNQCDFVLKYFDLRQKSRAEEMEAIEEAKAILSGANFA